VLRKIFRDTTILPQTIEIILIMQGDINRL
jgi:hypothetical protein